MEKNLIGINQSLANILAGKSIIITGAGSGLGKAIALALPFTGARVGVLDLNEKAVTEVVTQINATFPNNAVALVASVTSSEQLEKAYADFVTTAGPLFGLVNCAGLARLGSIESLTSKDIALANDVNINGYFLNAHVAAKHLIPQKQGCIINISSASARGVSENSSIYGVAKEAQCMMARSWALDLGKHTIRVNAVLAGDLYGDPERGIDSGIWNQSYFEKKAVDKGLVAATDPRLKGPTLNPQIRALVIDYYAKRTAFKKQITYADVINLIVMLFSPLGEKITGESIAVTAGNASAFSH